MLEITSYSSYIITFRERCYNKPLLTSVYNGKIQSGSVSAVIDAVKQGQSIQMISGRASLSVDHIEYNNIEDEFVIMDLWWIYATYSWNSLVDFLKFYVSTCTVKPV